jgi:hypothetical protein
MERSNAIMRICASRAASPSLSNHEEREDEPHCTIKPCLFPVKYLHSSKIYTPMYTQDKRIILPLAQPSPTDSITH